MISFRVVDLIYVLKKFYVLLHRIITVEREEGHHERQWYKTMDPSKSISIRTSIDVPSFPRSKWDSENEQSDNDNVFDNSPEDFVLTKEVITPKASSVKSDYVKEKSPSPVKLKPQSLPEPESKEDLSPEPEPEIKLDKKESKKEKHQKSKKSKHKSKSKISPKKKDHSPSHKKRKEEKKKEKHRKHHRHHKDKKHRDDDNEEQDKDKVIQEPVKSKSDDLQEEPVIGDEKLVSEYEQFMKMVSSTDEVSMTDKTLDSSVLQDTEKLPAEKKDEEKKKSSKKTKWDKTSPSSSLYEFSLEAKLSKKSLDDSAELDEIPIPTGKSSKENSAPKEIEQVKSTKSDKKEKKDKAGEHLKESKKSSKKESPLPEVYNLKYFLFLILNITV